MVLLKHIPHTLIVEILSWLPIKHLSPFRFVSKTWFQLITANPRFAKLHYDRMMKFKPNPSILAVVRRDHPTLYLANDYTSCDKAIALKFPFHNDRMSVEGFSNGILCLSDHENKEIHLLNPVTSDSITVSCLPLPSPRFSPPSCGLTIFGFGFDHSSNKYKLIRLFREHNYHYQVSVYTLGVDSAWRTIEDNLKDSAVTFRNLDFNGAIHWVSYNKFNADGDHEEILAFDLKGEVFRKVPPPNCVDETTLFSSKIVEFGGLLCMIRGPKSRDIEIWAMEEYGIVTSWYRKIRIERQDRFDTHNNYMSVLGIAPNGRIILHYDSQNPLLYDLETKSVVELKSFEFKPWGTYVHAGSIISPRFIIGGGTTLPNMESDRKRKR